MKYIIDFKVSCNNCDSHDVMIINAHNDSDALKIAEKIAEENTDCDRYYDVFSIEKFKEWIRCIEL